MRKRAKRKAKARRTRTRQPTGRDYCRRTGESGRAGLQSGPPRCELYGINLVDLFPPGCPFAVDYPLELIGQYQDRGWKRLSALPESDPGGLDDIERAECCNRCFSRLWGDPRIRRLRSARRASAPAPTPAKRGNAKRTNGERRTIESRRVPNRRRR